MTLADEDTNIIPTDEGNRAILGNGAGQLVAKIATNVSGTTSGLKLQLIQDARVMIVGMLCLWQCFFLLRISGCSLGANYQQTIHCWEFCPGQFNWGLKEAPGVYSLWSSLTLEFHCWPRGNLNSQLGLKSKFQASSVDTRSTGEDLSWKQLNLNMIGLQCPLKTDSTAM